MLIRALKNVCYFTESPPAVRHIWFIGDEFLDKAANSLRKLKNEPIFDASKPELFIYKEYNVQAFHDNEVKAPFNNPIRKVRNNLTMALNLYPTILPQYLLILLGNNYLHDYIFVEFEFKAILKRILNDVGRLLATRKEQIPRRVLNTFHSTEVFIMRPLPKPEAALRGNKKFKNTRRYVNNMLDRLSDTFDFRPLNIDEINCSQRALFEKNGQLSEYGQERMWFSISEFIRRKDQQLQVAVKKCIVPKEDAGAQVPEDNMPEKVDQYFTNSNHAQRDGRSSGASHQWQTTRAEKDFDDYHRSYDRTDYYNQYDYQDYHKY